MTFRFDFDKALQAAGVLLSLDGDRMERIRLLGGRCELHSRRAHGRGEGLVLSPGHVPRHDSLRNETGSWPNPLIGRSAV